MQGSRYHLHNAVGYAVHAVSESANGLMLAVLRRIVSADTTILTGSDNRELDRPRIVRGDSRGGLNLPKLAFSGHPVIGTTPEGFTSGMPVIGTACWVLWRHKLRLRLRRYRILWWPLGRQNLLL